MKQGLYMMVIVPPENLKKEIENIRFEFAEKYHAKAALKPPVHITLIPPFKAPETIENVLISIFSNWGKDIAPFPVTLQGYDVFYKNGVVFINVKLTDLLKSFQKDFANTFNDNVSVPGLKNIKSFHPHITIGYRDIPHELYPLAAREYTQKEFFDVFVVDKFYLWKHDGNQWQINHTFDIGRSVSKE